MNSISHTWGRIVPGHLVGSLVLATTFYVALALSNWAFALEVKLFTSRVTPWTAGPHFWWTLRSDPSNADRLIACALRNNEADERYLESVLYASEDRGENWRVVYVDGHASSNSEVACDIGSRGSLYVADSRGPGIPPDVLDRQKLDAIEHMYLSRSDDFGRNWTQTLVSGYQDSALLVATSKQGARPDSVMLLAHGAHGRYQTVAVSHDDGRTFGKGVVRLEAPPDEDRQKWFIWLTGAAGLADGTVGTIYLYPAPTSGDGKTPIRILYNRLSDSGVPIGEAVAISSLSLKYIRSFPHPNGTFQWARMPSIAPGRIAGKDRVFVVWHDMVGSEVRVLLASSDDNGSTWNKPRVVDDLPVRQTDLRGSSASHPSIAINSAGVIGLEWAEFDGACWRFAASTDGGQSFAPSVALNPCRPHRDDMSEDLPSHIYAESEMTRLTSGVRIVVTDWRGYFNIHRSKGLVASSDNAFHALWASFGARDDGVYHTRIEIAKQTPGTAYASNRPTASSDRDLAISDGSVWIDYTTIAYDEALQEFVLGATLVKRGPVVWPLKLCVRGVKSPLGKIKVVTADNGLDDSTVGWLFDGPAGELPKTSGAASDQEIAGPDVHFSNPRNLRFRLEHPTRGAKRDKMDSLVEIDGEVFENTSGRLSPTCGQTDKAGRLR